MKKKNDSESTARIKKQLVSTGVYIALAAVVVGITANSVKDILGSTKGYEIPENNGQNGGIVIPKIDDKSLGELPSQKDFVYPDITVSESPSGVNDVVTDPSDNSPASGEPDNVEEISKEQEPGKSELPIIDPKKEPTVKVKPTAGYISREFSKDELLYTPTMNDFRTHDGIDITGDIGSPVSAFADGVVSDIYDDPFMGMTVVISHSGGLVSSYSNLSKELPAEIYVGAQVSVGDTIGGIGESAIIESAEVPHVHFEIYKDEICVNPEDYLTAN
jgi:murein DD-endopeptidase MepM/ murein hydrolase activator NlpD